MDTAGAFDINVNLVVSEASIFPALIFFFLET